MPPGTYNELESEAARNEEQNLLANSSIASLLATAAQAIAGTDNLVLMTPLRVAQATESISASLLTKFPVFNAAVYGASGSAATTTGGISAGTASLLVVSSSSFIVGDGIAIIGAGPTGGNLITSITAISGLTFTLANTASTTVAGAVVQHDDSAAINLACAAAYNAAGGRVYLPNGTYRCNAAVIAATNSIIGFPVVALTSYLEETIYVEFVGESKGTLNATGTAGASGVVIDASNGPASGTTLFSVLSAAPYAATVFNATGCGFYNIHLHVDKVMILTAANPLIGGISMSNALAGSIGDDVAVFAKWSNTGVPRFSGWGTYGPVQPTNGGRGIVMPQKYNNKRVTVGSAQVMGFSDGLVLYEHSRLRNPQLAYCAHGIVLVTSERLNQGSVSLENNIYDIQVLNGNSYCDLVCDIEAGSLSASPSAWWLSTKNLLSTGGGNMIGRLAYTRWENGAASSIVQDTFANLTVTKLTP